MARSWIAEQGSLAARERIRASASISMHTLQGSHGCGPQRAASLKTPD
jgi:hypothetical protein